MSNRVGGAVFMIALARAFEAVFDPDRKREPTVMIQSGGPPPDGPYELHLGDDPATSRVILHWKRDR